MVALLVVFSREGTEALIFLQRLHWLIRFAHCFFKPFRNLRAFKFCRFASVFLPQITQIFTNYVRFARWGFLAKALRRYVLPRMSRIGTDCYSFAYFFTANSRIIANYVCFAWLVLLWCCWVVLSFWWCLVWFDFLFYY